MSTGAATVWKLTFQKRSSLLVEAASGTPVMASLVAPRSMICDEHLLEVGLLQLACSLDHGARLAQRARSIALDLGVVVQRAGV